MSVALTFQGVHAEILADETPEIDVEGSLNCGKTTMCLWKELEAIQQFPGIWSFAFRYSDTDTKTKIRPAIEQLCAIRGERPKWDGTELCYHFDNGSRMYSFGIKAADALSRYSKLRGLPVSRIYNDQSEELPEDMSGELRGRLRPDLATRLAGRSYRTQLTFSPNPLSERSWLAKQFPVDNRFKGRHYYSISLYDNAHNLPAETITGLEAAFPPDHPRHKGIILGQRGPNILGSPIYAGYFKRELHRREVPVRDGDLLEGFITGKSHPCWVIAQRTQTGSLQFLGGIMGVDLLLTDFLPIVLQYRAEWFGKDAAIKTCGAPTGAADDPTRLGDMEILRDYGFKPRWCENSNAPDVRLAMIEHLGDAMRHRTHIGDEALAVNDDPARWLEASREGIKSNPFLAEGFEVGYVKDDHFASVAHKHVRQPKDDDWFEMGMRAAEILVQNFCAGKPTQAERDAKRAADRTDPRPSTARSSMDWAG